jgi:hypothetical protein
MKVLELLSTYVIIPAAVLYFAGWIYLYTLCRFTGLDVVLLGLDTNSIIMNSYNVVAFAYDRILAFVASTWVIAIAGLVVVVALVTTFVPIAAQAFDRTRSSILSRVATAGLALWIATYVLGLIGIAALSQAAAKDYLAHLTSRPGARMLFDFKRSFVEESDRNCRENSNCYYVYLKRANDSSRLRMLLETPDYFAVWAQHVDRSP